MWLSAATILYFGAYCAITWDRPHRAGLVLLLVGAALATLGIARAPMERVLRSHFVEHFFLSWSASLIALVGIGSALDGGARSALTLGLFLPLAFASLSYPLRSMIAVGVMDIVAFLLIATLAGGASFDYAMFFAATLATFAWMCAWQSLNHDRHRMELALVSRTDPLTGALNRRGFAERFQAELDDSARHAVPLGVLQLDLDRFKEVNDSQGHEAGDDLLCWVTTCLRDVLRPIDAVGRLGGDEFAVVLPGAGPTDLVAVVERVRNALEERAPASIGVACFPDHGTSPEELLRRSDEQLYDRKRGRTTDGPRQLSWAAALASAVDERMAVRHEHSSAVANYAVTMARQLNWSERDIAQLRMAAMLHDVGKVRVPERILRKSDALTAEEYAEVRDHAAEGAEIVARIEGLEGIAHWIRHSHERLDGAGYPDGLRGEDIPMASRLIFVADAFDAMTSDRVYRRARPAEEALAELRENAGSQFDPECVELLEAALDIARPAA